MERQERSACPINLTIELIGDRWSLLILRDVMFSGRRHFRELLAKSEEGIATNVLAAKLQWLTEQGLLSRSADPTHRQKVVYSLTESAIELLPVLIQLGVWGSKHTGAAPEYARTFVSLDRKGPEAWRGLMDSLRASHLAASTTPGGKSHSHSGGRDRSTP